MPFTLQALFARRTAQPLSARSAHWQLWRSVRIAVVALLVVALSAGYALADAFDVLPGVLTLRSVQHSAVPRALHVIPARVMARDLSSSGKKLGQDAAGDVATAREAPLDAAALQQFLDAWKLSEGLSEGGAGVSLAVAESTGRIVAQLNADTPREPASVLKTLTAFAAASTLPMARRFATEAWLQPTRQGESSKSDKSNDNNTSNERVPRVVLRGNGDMLLGAGFNDATHINGRAGLASLARDTAQALRKRGIATVRVAVDDSYFGADRAPKHIDENNASHQFFAPLASVAIDGGRLWQGAAPADADDGEQYPVLDQHAAVRAGQVFAQALAKQGVQVIADGVSRVPVSTKPLVVSSNDAALLATVHSATLGEIMALMLRRSDNTLAEEFGRLLALHQGLANTSLAGVQAVRRVLREQHIDEQGLQMADCSGLSPGTLVRVATLVAVQARNLTPGLPVAAGEGLSVPGLIGTARQRLLRPEEAGLLRVKTGTLSAVTSLSGNISRRGGGVLAFSVIVNQPTNIEAAKHALDELMAHLASL